jgi:hypothetical protein
MLFARLGRRDATISQQRLQLQQLTQGAAGSADAAASEHSSAPAAAEWTAAEAVPAAAQWTAAEAAQNMHVRNEWSGRKHQEEPRQLLSAFSSATTTFE